MFHTIYKLFSFVIKTSQKPEISAALLFLSVSLFPILGVMRRCFLWFQIQVPGWFVFLSLLLIYGSFLMLAFVPSLAVYLSSLCFKVFDQRAVQAYLVTCLIIEQLARLSYIFALIIWVNLFLFLCAFFYYNQYIKMYLLFMLLMFPYKVRRTFIHLKKLKLRVRHDFVHIITQIN